MAPMAVEALGGDISASMLAVATENVPSARFIHGDITMQPLGLGEFDLVTVFRVLAMLC